MIIRSTTSRKWLSMALIIAFAISIAILGAVSLPAVYAQDDAPKAKRTIMYYEDGCDPETTAGAASANLVEAMNAEFDNTLKGTRSQGLTALPRWYGSLRPSITSMTSMEP